jgi:prolyl-tRNA synthetase
MAPAQVHMVAIKRSDPAVSQAAEQLYDRLQAGGHTVFYDDRDERAGVAFKDADLIGLPLRLTVSQRALEAGGVEAKWRHESDLAVVTFDALDDVLSLLS